MGLDAEKIQKQAKNILDNFVSALGDIDFEEKRVEREQDRRLEGGDKTEIDRKIMFENAPRTKKDCIEAEKGGWV